MKKKYKVVLSNDVKKKLEKMSLKDKRIVMKGIDRIAENPYSGKKTKLVEIESWENEVCDKCNGGCFEEPVKMYWDKNSDEIYCRCGICNDCFWMTKKELLTGRTKYLKLKKERIFEIKKK